jgi:uncharacterized phage protein (TIGR02220 family)
MANDPAFLFYSQDFLTGVQDLTMEERGQYITMLCVQHQKGSVSSKWLSICLPDASTDVLKKFEKNENGDLYSPRLAEEIEKRKGYIPFKLASATLGGLISANKVSKANAKKIKEEFEVKNYASLSKEDIKKEVSIWFKHMLKYIENENDILSISNNKIDYNKLLIFFNSVTGKKTKVVTDKVKSQIKARLSEGFTKEDIANAIKNCSEEKYHKENGYKYLTLEFITRPDKLERYAQKENKQALKLKKRNDFQTNEEFIEYLNQNGIKIVA